MAGGDSRHGGAHCFHGGRRNAGDTAPDDDDAGRAGRQRRPVFCQADRHPSRFVAPGTAERPSPDARPALGQTGPAGHRESEGLLRDARSAQRIRGKLSGYEYLSIKIRHAPFSVYAYFQAPLGVKGQEVIYIAGQNQGNILAHKAHMSATVSLHPDGLIAMSGRHYPITEIGLVNLVWRLVEVGEQDLKYGECEVKYFSHAKINQRPCTVIQVVHPLPRDVFLFHLARVFVDDEWKLPIRYESYDWPTEPGGEPRLIEEYTYLDLKLNNGFTDEDFSTQNPEYHFR